MNTGHLLSSTRPMTALRFAFVGLALLASNSRAAAAPVPAGVSAADWTSIRAVYEANRHAAFALGGGHEARNPGQQWKTRFDGCGFTTQPDRGAWQWGLELRAYGFGDRKQVMQGSPEVKAEGQRVTYVWDGNVEEWFVNDQRGLEHGFTVAERPPGASEPDANGLLIFELAVRGTLQPESMDGGQGLRFTNETGADVVTYTGLKVWDADGKMLPARMEPIAGRAGGMFRIAVDERGARYPLTIDPIAQQVYLKASNTAANDFFGTAVAVSGNTVVVGAPEEDSSATGVNGDQSKNDAPESGAAYVFVFNNGSWTQEAYLKASNARAEDFFGASVAISGAIVIGAPGEDSSATGVDGNQANNGQSEAGAAYVFEKINFNWRQTGYLKASNTEANDHFGHSVAISGGTVVVGALDEDGSATLVNGNSDNGATDSGAAYVFFHKGPNVTFTSQAYLKASNTGAGKHFGQSVGISDDAMVIGASTSPAYVFRRAANVWTHEADLTPSGTEPDDFFGKSVAISGDIIVVGAPNEDSNATGVGGDPSNNNLLESGAAYVFVHGTSWNQQAYLKASNPGAQDGFGSSVSVSGDTILVGASGEDSNATGVNGNQSNNSLPESGAAYLFNRSGATWSQEAYLKASNTGGSDFFGVSVSLDGRTSVIGADGEASNAPGVNGNQNNDSALNAGAVYTFGCFRTHFSLTPANTGFNAERIIFATVERLVLHQRIVFIGNTGATDLVIQSITLSAAPGLSLTVQTTAGGAVTLPHTIPAGSTTQGLKLTFSWTPEFNQFLDAELRIVTNDPGCSDPIIYHVLGAARRPSVITAEEQLEEARLTRLAGGPGSRPAAPNATETATFEFDATQTPKLTAEIPAFLGGGSVQLNNFSGNVTLSQHSIPNDPSRTFIRVESGSFTTPSFQLPNGVQTGVNTLTFGAAEESSGILEVASGNYTASATAMIVNNLFPGGVVVRGNYSGKYDAVTGKFTVQSQSKDLFEEGGLLNIATRLRVQTGNNVLIGGFIISGTDPKKVLARGIGPSLSSFFPDFLADPTLELFQGNTLLGTNDNWKTKPDGSSQQAEIEATTIPPSNDLEAALVRTLPANGTGYTAIVRGTNNTTGIGVVEVYDLDTTVNSKLANVSTRGLVETGNNVLIGGFIPGNGVAKVLVRAIGPTLVNAGVPDPLQDPTLELVNASGTSLATNDNWKIKPDGSSQQAEIEATTIPPTDDRESALVASLLPGNYTAVVRGKNNTIGIAVVEVYNIP